MADCPSTAWKSAQANMPYYVTPIPYSVGSNEDLGGYLGALVWNVLIILVIGLLHYVVCLAFRAMRGSGYELHRAFAALSFPGLLWFPALLLYQTTLQSALRVILYSPNPVFKTIASLGGISLIVVPPGLVLKLIGTSPDLEYIAPKRLTKLQWMFERGRYKHKTNPAWVPRYFQVLALYRTETKWFACFDLFVLVALAVVTAIDAATMDHCIARAAAAMILFLVQLLSMLLIQPFSAKFDNFFFVLAYAIQAAVMALVLHTRMELGALGTPTTSEQQQLATETYAFMMKVISHVLLAFASLLVVKAVIDWWRLFRDGLKACATMDPRNDRSLNSGKAAMDIYMEDLLEEKMKATKDANRGDEEYRLEVPIPSQDAASMTVTNAKRTAALVSRSVTYDAEGRARMVTGFSRAFDPAYAAMDQDLVAEASFRVNSMQSRLDAGPRSARRPKHVPSTAGTVAARYAFPASESADLATPVGSVGSRPTGGKPPEQWRLDIL